MFVAGLWDKQKDRTRCSVFFIYAVFLTDRIRKLVVENRAFFKIKWDEYFGDNKI